MTPRVAVGLALITATLSASLAGQVDIANQVAAFWTSPDSAGRAAAREEILAADVAFGDILAALKSGPNRASDSVSTPHSAPGTRPPNRIPTPSKSNSNPRSSWN